jgi:O-antigen/teichoic acid export membrane protein
MKSQIKQVGKHSFIFGFGDAMRGMIGFLLIPIYTRYLTPADYGQLELLSITLSILSILACQGINNAFFRTYAFIDKEMKASIRDLVSTSYIYMMLSALFVSTLLYIFSEKYSIFLFGKNNSPELLVKIIAFTIFFQIVMIVPYTLLRAKMESIKYISISLTQFLFMVFLNIFFVTVLKTGLKGILLGNAVSSFLMAVITFLLIKRHLIFKISKRILRDLLSFGVPLVMAGMSLWVLQVSDRFLLQKLSSTHELGLFALGSRFAGILLLLIVTPFQKVWASFSFQIAAKEQAKETFKTITTYFFLILCFVGILIIVWTPLLIKFVAGEDFRDAYKVVSPLVYANIGGGMFLISVFGMYLLKKTKYISYIVGIGAVVNIILNSAVIPRYGMMGAAFASFVSYMLINFLSYRLSQRFYYIPFDKLRLAKICFIFVIVSLFSSIFQFSNSITDIIYRFILIALFFAGFFVVKFFEDREIIYIKQIYNRLRKNKGISNKLKYAFEFIKH